MVPSDTSYKLCQSCCSCCGNRSRSVAIALGKQRKAWITDLRAALLCLPGKYNRPKCKFVTQKSENDIYVILVLTWQRYRGEAGGERLAYGLQVLVEKPVASSLLDHVALETVYRPPHALHVFLQCGVALLILHIGLTQLPHLSLTCCWTTQKNTWNPKQTQITGGDQRSDTARCGSRCRHTFLISSERYVLGTGSILGWWSTIQQSSSAVAQEHCGFRVFLNNHLPLLWLRNSSVKMGMSNTVLSFPSASF